MDEDHRISTHKSTCFKLLALRLQVKLLRWSARITCRVLTPFGTVLAPQRWIFVVGCYNSGTTLLERILASHPTVGGLPAEGIYFTDVLPYPGQFGWPRMWARCLGDVRLEPDSLSPTQVRRIKKQWSFYLPRDKENLVEKSAVNATRMPFLDRHFSPAFFVSVVRNGFAVAEGIRRRTRPLPAENPEYGEAYPLELCAEQWLRSDEVITRDRRKVDRFLQVRYEDLTESPKATLREVTDFLGIAPFSPPPLTEAWFVRDRLSPVRNMNASSFGRLSEQEVVAIQSVAERTLSKYGYSYPGR